MAKEFQGKIELDIRDSTPDWSPYLADKAPQGSPNVLIVLYDDTGLAAWSPFSGRIEVPTMDRLAGDGLTYSQWHTTALCGPTRSCFLTGRNHHQNSFATIAETAAGFPGNNTHIPMENAFQAEVMREHGWATYKILAEVQIADPSCQGVILAQGSRFGGHALFIKDRRLHYVYNFLGLKPEQHLQSEPLAPGAHVLGVEFVKEGQGEHRETLGTARL